MGARLTTYYKKTSPTDQGATELRSQQWTGLHMPLEPQDDSPFLGEVAPGTSQTALETNLFHAPTFPHKVPSTDFLLVRNAKGKLTLRKIDALNVVGQQVNLDFCFKCPPFLFSFFCVLIFLFLKGPLPQ